MTIYIPTISNQSGPKYRVIADAILKDIQDKRLVVGQKLPTHRDLAYRLGVTVGTITRSYAQLQRRGVVGGRVGSGTFVLDATQHNPVFPDSVREPLIRNDNRITLAHPGNGEIDLSMNRPTPGPEAEQLGKTLAELAQADGLSILTQYNPAPGMPHHRAAMASLLQTIGLDCTGDDIILTNGAQHAMAACAVALLNAGDTLLTEHLTYPGMTSIASHIGVQLHPVSIDEYGMRPDALEAAVRETGASMVYLIPIMQNPTNATMNRERLNAIADVAKRHNLILLEDDVYGFQPKTRNPPLAQLAPDNTVYINGFSKSIAPGLRVGCMKVPKPYFTALTQAVQITGWMIAPLMGEIATRWIETGIAQNIIKWHQGEAIARIAIAQDVLSGFTFKSQPESLHIWLDLPEGHHADHTMRALRAKGVIMSGPESFITNQANIPRCLRLCLGSPPSREQLHTGLDRVRQVLSSPPISSLSRLDNMVI